MGKRLRPIIRSLTVFVHKPREELYEELIEAVYTAKELLSIIKKNILESGYEIFTTRISLPKLSIELLEKILDDIKMGDALVSVGAIDAEDIDEELAINITERGYYFSIYGIYRNPIEYSYRLSRLISALAEHDPLLATRISIAYHKEPLETPYFPDSTSSGELGLGVAFLYPHIIKRLLEESQSILTVSEKISNEISRIVGVLHNIGIGRYRIIIDYSISPWMEKSVVDLIETMGYKLLEPGFNYGVYLLNDLIKKISQKIGFAKGYNEVMLPYAEDSSLIDAGKEGVLKAHHLLLYTATCVAGPDMLIVPNDPEKLWRFLLDVYSVWLVKQKPISTRIIPVSGKPGDKVELGKFGTVYIIDY